MRYYAGNWAYNIWLVRKGSAAKLGKLDEGGRHDARAARDACCPTPRRSTSALTLSLAHRFMHLEGRPLLEALPRAVDDIEDYEWIDGEVVAAAWCSAGTSATAT